MCKNIADDFKEEMKRYWIALYVGIAVIVVQLYGVFESGSLSLLADTNHAGVDITNTSVALCVMYLIKNTGEEGRYREIGAFIGMGLLTLGSFVIFYEAIQRLISTPEIDSVIMSRTSLVGLAGNVYIAWMLHRVPGEKRTITHIVFNLHVLMDTGMSVIVVTSSYIMRYTGWNLVDPVLGMMMSRFLFCNALLLVSFIFVGGHCQNFNGHSHSHTHTEFHESQDYYDHYHETHDRHNVGDHCHAH